MAPHPDQSWLPAGVGGVRDDPSWRVAPPAADLLGVTSTPGSADDHSAARDTFFEVAVAEEFLTLPAYARMP